MRSNRSNIFRWYRAGGGRYSQADPIDLDGGINLFAYALENPLRNKDPLGLKVYKCCAPADVAGGLVNHCWIKADKQQTQIGFANEGQPAGIDPGGACASPFFSQTQVQLYKGNKKGTNCTEITDVDEKCVDDAGNWGSRLCLAVSGPDFHDEWMIRQSGEWRNGRGRVHTRFR